jgi:hypothetical protein
MNDTQTPARPAGGGLRTGQIVMLSICYLRAAQAYMLISMPTCTSTIFGVFQLISVSRDDDGAMIAPL